MKKIIAASFFVLSSLLVFGQARKYSNEFLAIGVGARSLGLSNSVVATTNDVTSGYWNPAGLTQIKSNMQISAMHAEYFAGIANYDYGGLAYNIDSSSAFAINAIRFGVDDIANTTQLIDNEGNVNYDNIFSFSAADYGILLSYARKLKVEGLSVGASAKIVHRKVGDLAKSWGFGIDAGAQYTYKGWNFGLMARDITTTFNAWSFDLDENTIEVFTLTGNEIPDNSVELTLPKIILGAGRTFKIKESFTLMTEVNFDLTTDGKRNVVIKGDPISIDPHLGLELGFKNLVFLRGGVGNIQTEKSTLTGRDITTFQPNIGLGLKIRNFYLDYAFTDIGDRSVGLYSHIFSLKLDIYKKG
ncbi:MAG: PorV/PorQ family protein [Flavobacteriales bacterium]|nr:PorV/PorQ family protein [Flavobacteriales bacterium]